MRELLLAINRGLGIAMVVIEQHQFRCRQSISVMSEGGIIAGDAAAVVSDPRVQHAYFGEQAAA